VSWESRYGVENFHNGKIHRDFWLEEWEKKKISEYYRVHATEGYRAVAYRMMDEDVVATKEGESPVRAIKDIEYSIEPNGIIRLYK